MLDTLLAWFKRNRFHQSASHCLEGLLVFFPCALVARSWWVAALCVVVWYWSRKKLECEVSAETAGQTHVDVWAVGWFPWEWTRYYVLDVLLPLVSSCLLAGILSRFI